MSLRIHDTTGIYFSAAETLCAKPKEIDAYIHDSGLFAVHNMPCAVCKEKHAVLNLSLGVFEPCWGCQETRHFALVDKTNTWKFKLYKWLVENF